jgi:hypothetical protein
MLKRFQNYIETAPWERYLEDDTSALLVFSWAAIFFAVVWFVPTMVRILVNGPTQ